MFLEPSFTYDDQKYYVGFSFAVIIENSKISLKYLLALLNSKYGFYWFINNAKERGVGFDVTLEKLRSFPIPNLNNENKKYYNKIIEIVETLLSNNYEDKLLLDQIDKSIFKICNLNKNQIKEIEETISNFLNSRKSH